MIEPGSAGTKERSTHRTRWVAWGSSLLLVVAVTSAVLKHNRGPADAPPAADAKPVLVETALVASAPMEYVVTAQGTLVASQGASARIAAVTGGRLVSVLVREGDRVAAGEVVAVVDSRVQQEQARGAAAALRSSELQATQAKLAAQAAATDQANAVRVARLELETAEAELRKVRSGPRPQEIAQADQAVKQAEATRDRAATELERAKLLYEKGVYAKRQLDDATTAHSVAESELASARQQADLLRAGARPEDLRTAELRVEIAQAALAQAEQSKLQVAAKETEASATAESVRQQEADLAAAQVAAGYAELRSPIGGVVTSRMMNPGDMADPSAPVIEVTDPRTVDVLASIPAEDGMKLRPGLLARVSATDAPARRFAGRVRSVGQVDPQSGLLEIRIAVGNQDGLLKVGAFATADIVTGTNPHAIVVRKQAVITRDGKTVVFVVGPDGKAHLREVATGAERGQLVEVPRGVNPGDRVILLGQYELAEGMRVQPMGGKDHTGADSP
jgi:HlyD family secretion protein